MGEKIEKIISSPEAFRIKQFQRKIDALSCILPIREYTASPLTALEYAQLHHMLLSKDFNSLDNFLNNYQVQLNRLHANLTRFRKSAAVKNIFFATDFDHENYVEWLDVMSANITIISTQVKNSDYSLLEMNPLKIFKQEIKERKMADGYNSHRILCQLEIPNWLLAGATTFRKTLSYHPLLGLGSSFS